MPDLAHGLHRRPQISKKANEIRDITYLQKFHSFANVVRQQDNTYINELKGVFNAKPKNEIQKVLYC